MTRRARPALLAALALGVLACRRGPVGPPPERFLPAAPRAAVLVPEARRAARELAALHEAIAGWPGAAELASLRGALAAQLGFDPLDPDALAGAGIDPRRGAALAAVDRPAAAGGGRDVLLVLPVGDPEKLQALFARLARERLGAPERTSEARGAASVVTFRRSAADPPALSYVLVERTALLSAGPGGPQAVAEAAARPPAASLAESAAWRTARRALGERYAALAFAPAGSPLLAGAWPVRDGLAVGAAASASGVSLGAAVLLGDREPSFRALAAGGSAAKAAARLDPAAALVGRWDGDFGALGRKLLPVVPAPERRRLEARGLDPQRDLLDLLAPGGAVALSLPPALDVPALSEASLRADPLALAWFEAVVPLRDPAAAAEASARLVRAAAPKEKPRRGRPAPPEPPADGVFRIRTASGEIAWRVDAAAGRLEAAGGPPGRLDALRARLDGAGPGFRAPTPASARALEGGLGGAVLDAQRLVASVRALPDEAFGTGPSGFVVRSVVDRFLDPASRLSAVSLRADLADGALLLALEVEAAPAGGAP